jgi:predicted ATPase with chaperone activity
MRLGPAISSGKAIFIYGPPGNGKTTIAETMGGVLPGTVYMPYSIIVRGEIINIFDPVNHIPAEPEEGHSADRRWLLIRRPVIMAGGELSLRMLDLDFNDIAKFYEAPLQIKANNGLFIVDDFGRQQVEPHSLLNRWIVPLDRRTDFMTLHTGMKFDVPFDQLVIFSTNIEPKKLVDEAFLRRIRYKIKIDHPSAEEYEAIFRRVCEHNGMEFRKDVFDYLMDNYYKRLAIKLNACHPRDIIDHIIDDAHYYDHPPQLTKEGVDAAWKNYFVDM